MVDWWPTIKHLAEIIHTDKLELPELEIPKIMKLSKWHFRGSDPHSQ